MRTPVSSQDPDKLRILHLSYSDILGGAARAAYRIHKSLLDNGLHSTMSVNLKQSDDWSVSSPSSKLRKSSLHIRPYVSSLFAKVLNTDNVTLHSASLLPSHWPQQINSSNADVVHLHWVQREMLSVSDIRKIRKPIVWTLHDMWPFCGAEHYTDDFRWRDGYRSCNRPSYESLFDLNRWTWERKLKSWTVPMHIVANSQWMAKCASSSVIMRNWPIHLIHYPLDFTIWRPMDQRLARNLSNLPQDCPLILFGAIGGGGDPRKGMDLLISALGKIKASGNYRDLRLIVFGQGEPAHVPDLGFPVHYSGRLHDDLSLRALYCAADVMVVPSRQEAFGQTASEAHSCGTPVVAFNVGGLADIVDHHVTGALAAPFDHCSLAHEICWVIADTRRNHCLGRAARLKAVKSWCPRLIAKSYHDLYCNVIEDSFHS